MTDKIPILLCKSSYTYFLNKSEQNPDIYTS